MAVEEEWRVVPGFPFYLVSDQGNVDSLVQFIPASGGYRGARRMVVGPEYRWRLKPFDSVGRKRWATAYQRVYMHRFDEHGNRFKAQMMVHRLVLMAFVGPCPEGHEASHLNGLRNDNRLVNLAWETAAQNYERRVEHQTILKGERHPAAKLTSEQVVEMRRLVYSGVMQKRVAATFGISKDSVSRIALRQRWRHL